MAKKDEMLKSAQIVKDAQVKLATFKNHLDMLEKEIVLLSNLEIKLEENLFQLKNGDNVPLASEYKKIKDDMKKVKTRLTNLNSDKVSVQKVYKSMYQIYETNKEIYEKLSSESEDNVLQGDFGRNRE